MILIDNDDSFTYNLVHAFQVLGQSVEVVRSRTLSVKELFQKAPDLLVVGPGPGKPRDAGISKAVIAESDIPLLGVCLGHQAIGEVFGAKVGRANQPMHGKLSLIHHKGEGIFKGLPSPFPATRYHSLVITELSSELEITAWTEEGEVMGVAHRSRPLYGVQFHPESITTQEGMRLLTNFCERKD